MVRVQTDRHTYGWCRKRGLVTYHARGRERGAVDWGLDAVPTGHDGGGQLDSRGHGRHVSTRESSLALRKHVKAPVQLGVPLQLLASVGLPQGPV